MPKSQRAAVGTDIVLKKIGQARDLLAQARDAKGAKRVVDIAHAAEIYAKRQKLSQESIDYAHEIKIEALKLLGQYLATRDKPAGARGKPGPGRGKKTGVRSGTAVLGPPTLSEIGISPRESKYSQKLARLAKERPSSFEAVKRGEKTYQEVHREQRKREAHQAVKKAEALKGKFRILYADCPWKYGDAGYGHGPAEFHYPTMSIDELCALPVADIALKNSVLFFWVTSPLLEDAFPVINAWGFKYRASFIWDKVKHNVGHYNSVRHEFLLICTRGSCTPDDSRLIDSVQEIERGKHSEKPEKFRKIINQMYPHGKRIELFARKATKGWEVYGNELK